jgi:hypothetical protein
MYQVLSVDPYFAVSGVLNASKEPHTLILGQGFYPSGLGLSS